MGKTKFYAVKNGRNGPHIYNTWEECKKDVTGFSGAVFKSFGNLKDAQVFSGLSQTYTNDSDNNNIPKDNTDSKKYQHLKIRLTSIEAIDEILREIDLKKLAKTHNIPKNIKIYTDGSCTNIGTPHAIAGSGIYYPDFNFGLSVKVPRDQTNNRGELWATIYGICFLDKLFQKMDINYCTGQTIFQINTDSTYTLNNLRNKAVANLDLCQLLIELNNSHKLEFCKVLAHSGDPNNEIADELARYFVFVEP